MPKSLLMLLDKSNVGQFNQNLAQKLIGPKSIVVPDRNLDDPRSQILETYSRIHEGLVPCRMIGINHCFGTFFGRITKEFTIKYHFFFLKNAVLFKDAKALFFFRRVFKILFTF